MTTPQLPEKAGAADKLAVTTAVPETDTGAAVEDLTYVISASPPLADAAGAVDGISVRIGAAPAPVPGTAIKIASPAFIRSQMPRMHVQNLLTGAWWHRDVQGLVSPSITWALNAADTFSCTLAPPRPDMMDASGNALLLEWRDAIYLEESDEVRFGGIVTSSTMAGPQWQVTATGFAGYATGMPYEGPNITRTNIDALDAVRTIWSWLQSQPGGNIGLELGTAKAGFNLGAQIPPGIQTVISAKANAGQNYVWLGDATAFTGKESIAIAGYPYTISRVVTNAAGKATGQVFLTTALGEPHNVNDPVAQTSPVRTTLSRAAANAANNVWLADSSAFANGEIITIGGDMYTVNQVLTGATSGLPSGNITLMTNLRKAYGAGTAVIQVRTITPWQMLWYNSTDCGQEIGSIQQEAIFDWREHHYWSDRTKGTIRHQLTFGVPRIGTRLTGLRFAEGENIIQAVTVTRDGSKYANDVIGLGAGQGSATIRTQAANLNTGRLRRSYIYTDQTIYTLARLAVKAQKVLTSMQNIDTVTTIVVKNHPNAPWGSFSPGDDIPVMLASGWRNAVVWSRITAMTQDPTTDLMTLTLARSDSFTYMPQTGQAGTLLCRTPCSTRRSARSWARSASCRPVFSNWSATSGPAITWPTARSTRTA